MSTPLPLPMRILVNGPSTVFWSSGMGGPRTDMHFPRVAEQILRAGGRPVEFRLSGGFGSPTRQMFDDWDELVAKWSPDVVVISAGFWETVHILQPPFIERRANTEHRRVGRFGYYKRRRQIFRALSRLVLKLQARLDKPGGRVGRAAARRALVDTQTLIDMTSRVGSPLILLLGSHQNASSRDAMFSGWEQRRLELDENLRALAEKNAHKNVRVLPVRDLIEQLQPLTRDELFSDGIHYAPQFHRAVGERLAAIAEEWARTQPHLDLP